MKTSRAVTVRRRFPHPRDEVFAAWTDPAALASWFGGAAAKTLSAAVDLQVGGGYRLTVQSGSHVAAVEGAFLEVEEPERLVYTWRWDREGSEESIVTVEFLEAPGGTDLVLTHEGLENGASLVFHDGGWRASLEQLGAVLAA